jgi:formylglycine-generating enzyme required for sulfatase activity
MKITKNQLKKIIKEELGDLWQEEEGERQRKPVVTSHWNTAEQFCETRAYRLCNMAELSRLMAQKS